MSRLYLIEDHLMVRQGLRILLETGKHTVVGETADPTQALSDLQRLAPDVALLDLALGGRSGFELLAEMQRRGLRVRVVVLTMSSLPRDVGEALRLGANGYVLKTAPIVEVTQAIDAVGQGRLYLGSGVSELAVHALTHPSPETELLALLSPRERQIVRMVVDGASSAEIGRELHLSAKTVDTYRSRLMAKLQVRDVPGLVRLALRTGLIAADG